jgi:WD40 repeat protein
MKYVIGHENAVLCTALSNDDTLLVSGSENNTIKIWDVRNGRHIRTLCEHEQNVMGCCLTYDDRFIISSDPRLWGRIKKHHAGDQCLF